MHDLYSLLSFILKVLCYVSDSAIFILTISRTLIIYRRHRHGAAIPLIKIMMRDGNNHYTTLYCRLLTSSAGIVYFLVIFVANAVTVTLFLVSDIIIRFLWILMIFFSLKTLPVSR